MSFSYATPPPPRLFYTVQYICIQYTTVHRTVQYTVIHMYSIKVLLQIIVRQTIAAGGD